eukprot:Nitzschia sp. Nitz4//scaffold93_size78505//75962//78458//NITZ4_005433-RA/size78505-processed-gene-0.94-mRNA-1//1//CDS//3329560327//7975//frame0
MMQEQQAPPDQHETSSSTDSWIDQHQEDEEANVVNAKRRAAEEERKKLASRESKVIWHNAEDDFESEFDYVSDTVLEKYTFQIVKQLNALDGLSIQYTSYALESNQTFPFVILPDFEYRSANARLSANMLSTIYMPVVMENERAEWEMFARENLDSGLEVYIHEEELKQSQDQEYGLESVELASLSLFGNATSVMDLPQLVSEDWFRIWYPGIYTANDEPTDMYFPIWQYSPSLPPSLSLLNLDTAFYDFVGNALRITQRTGRASIDSISILDDNDESPKDASVFELLIRSGQYRHTAEHYGGDPVSTLTYPVFDHFEEDKNVVGVIYASLYWRFLFTDILSSNVKPLHCILKNTNGQVFTYQLDGNIAHFEGEGDLHNPSFDYIGKSVHLAEDLLGKSSPLTRSFTSMEFDIAYMNYTLTVYPTDSFHDHYVTSQARTDALYVGFLFLFSFLVFSVYDCYIQRRQRIVMDRAVKATVVLGSLYPENVREHIINDTDIDDKKQRGGNAFLRKTVSVTATTTSTSTTSLASKYPNCTVYFADLAGFTHWASTREPEQVFQLLEALYGAFDSIALKRSVYKVETVGDCYMAATGLPNPQPDHAVRMAKFVTECKEKMEEITTELTATLGDGTDDVALRTGMLSGEVTAGVLRGEKGRFQLFGDTVNTASRMESTGIPRSIQISQATADELILAGKESWFVPRQDQVYAKGKGYRQTYFLNVRASSDKASSETPRTTISVLAEGTPIVKA